jgi:hypothetical protein
MAFQPMPLRRRPTPFDHPDWVFEIKYDGFRALAVIRHGRCDLISRNGHPFNSFDSLRKGLTTAKVRLSSMARSSAWTDAVVRDSMTSSSIGASRTSSPSTC